MPWYPWYPLHSSVTRFGGAEMAMEFEIVSSGQRSPHAAAGPMLKNTWKHIRYFLWSGLIIKAMLKKNWQLEKLINTGKSDLVRFPELLKMWRNYASGNPAESSATWKFRGKIGRKKKNSKVYLTLKNGLFANKCSDYKKIAFLKSDVCFNTEPAWYPLNAPLIYYHPHLFSINKSYIQYNSTCN